MLPASGSRCFPTDAVGAYRARIRQLAGSIGPVRAIGHAGSSCSLVDCKLRVDIDSVVGDMLECGIVCRCIVAAGGENVGDVEGCNWMTVLATAVDVCERNSTSGGVLNDIHVQVDSSVLEVFVFLSCNCSLH